MFGQKSDGRQDRLIAAWCALQESAPVGPIRSEAQHRALLELLDYLHSIVGESSAHPLLGLMEIVVGLIEDYEMELAPVPHAKPRQVLRFLMEENGLRQSDLAKELGSQSVVSEVLRGKREINARQARALAKRFKVLPMAFI
jgi:HTH-type transcriptional regulator / antitoxin HigA